MCVSSLDSWTPVETTSSVLQRTKGFTGLTNVGPDVLEEKLPQQLAAHDCHLQCYMRSVCLIVHVLHAVRGILTLLDVSWSEERASLDADLN